MYETRITSPRSYVSHKLSGIGNVIFILYEYCFHEINQSIFDAQHRSYVNSKEGFGTPHLHKLTSAG